MLNLTLWSDFLAEHYWQGCPRSIFDMGSFNRTLRRTLS
jgi:hypothetical protein